jgi:putative membrane protein
MSDAVALRAVAPADASRPKRWSHARLAGVFVLAAWAGLFWFLWLSGRDAFFLSSRTDWIVPVAAVLLTAATVGRTVSARVRAPQPLPERELWIAGLLVLPVVLILAAPPATLGTFSAGKRADFAVAGFATSVNEIGEGALTLVDVAAGQTGEEGERALAAHAGETVRFVGFVSRFDDTPADEFLLTRYVVSCCVADAMIASVRTVNVTPGVFAEDDWVEVTGTIYPLGSEVILEAIDIQGVETPDRPYLTA